VSKSVRYLVFYNLKNPKQYLQFLSRNILTIAAAENVYNFASNITLAYLPYFAIFRVAEMSDVFSFFTRHLIANMLFNNVQ